MNRITKLALTLATSIFATLSAQADLYTLGNTYNVSGITTGRGESATLNADYFGSHRVFAGVINLTIGGIGTVQGFCIDPYIWAYSGNFVAKTLSAAPTSNDGNVNPMGAAAATDIRALWDMYFDDAMANNQSAAALQIAIWKTVDAGVEPADIISLSANSTTLALANTYLNSLDTYVGNGASLVGLTRVDGQDFVVRQVPDGGATVLLLGLGLTGLALMRRRI